MARRENRRRQQGRKGRYPRLRRRSPRSAQRADAGRCRAAWLGLSQMARSPRLAKLFFGRVRGLIRRGLGLSRPFVIGFHTALELQGHRLPEAVAALSRGDLDPAFGNRIFDDVGLFLAVELDPDPTAQQLFIEVLTT